METRSREGVDRGGNGSSVVALRVLPEIALQHIDTARNRLRFLLLCVISPSIESHSQRIAKKQTQHVRCNARLRGEMVVPADIPRKQLVIHEQRRRRVNSGVYLEFQKSPRFYDGAERGEGLVVAQPLDLRLDFVHHRDDRVPRECPQCVAGSEEMQTVHRRER